MLVTENTLDEWVRGHSRDAQGVIVELLWRLVAAAAPRPKDRRFPLGDSIGQHGPDGFLDVDLGVGPFVPEGPSYWEVGTGLNAGDKATSDYSDLTTATPLDVRKASTFVFVTPLSGRRDWEGSWKPNSQLDWIDRRLKLADWKDVRAIDGTKLVDWLHSYPAVELWLAQQMGLGVIGQIDTLGQHWALTESIGDPPPLLPDLK